MVGVGGGTDERGVHTWSDSSWDRNQDDEEGAQGLTNITATNPDNRKSLPVTKPGEEKRGPRPGWGSSIN